MKKSLAILGALGAAVLTLSACTDSAAPPATSPTATSGGEEPAAETRTVRVAALPIAETGALWAAIDAGIFAEHGFEVEVVPAQGGAQAIPALLSGDIQIAIGQPFGPFRADLQDLGIVMIGDYANSQASGQDVNAVVSLADSGITSPADLAGKRVSVNSLGAAGDVTIMQAVADAGADPTTIEFVEVAFPDAQAQLESGNIDAAWVPDPFMSMIAAEGNIVMHPYQETIPGLTVLTTITTQELLDTDPQFIQGFAEAMADALAWAEENEESVRAAIAENLGIPEAAAAGITLPVFTPTLTVEDLTALAEIAVDFGVLPSLPDFDRLVQQQ